MSITEDNDGHLAELRRRARQLGASAAVPLPASDVVIDDRTGLKCQVPLCRSYGRNLMCPPNVMPASRFRDIVACYTTALVVAVDMALDGHEDEARLRAARDGKRKLCDIIFEIESACIRQGHHFAAGFGAGSCSLCDDCVGVASGLPCRHPFRARPAMEAVGIDVMETARRTGLDLTFGPNAGRSWVGLLLVC